MGKNLLEFSYTQNGATTEQMYKIVSRFLEILGEDSRLDFADFVTIDGNEAFKMEGLATKAELRMLDDIFDDVFENEEP